MHIVINTWPFTTATKRGWETFEQGGTFLDVLENGLHQCEIDQCDFSVGFGGSPNEQGQTTLDALFMNGQTREVGAVANLKRVRQAIKVARQVSVQTYHSLLVGDDATQFAARIGFDTNQNLTTPRSYKQWQDWIAAGNMLGKKQPPPPSSSTDQTVTIPPITARLQGHDTIGMVVMDDQGNTACGTSTNGLSYRIPGRVGDSPIPGSGAYCEQGFGAAATGNGDFIMRFLPSMRGNYYYYYCDKLAVMYMKLLNMSPKEACIMALQEISKIMPPELSARTYVGLICVNNKQQVGAAAIGEFTQYFQYAMRNNTMTDVGVFAWNA